MDRNKTLQQHEETYKRLSDLLCKRLNKAQMLEDEAYYIQIELINYEKQIALLKDGKLESIDFESRYLDSAEDGFNLEKYFEKMRFDRNHHLGLGDIRLTISQQVEIVNNVKRKYA